MGSRRPSSCRGPVRPNGTRLPDAAGSFEEARTQDPVGPGQDTKLAAARVPRSAAMMAARSIGAGYPDGRGFPEITLTYNTNAEWRTFAEYAQQRWKDTLGISVRVEAMEFATFLKWRKSDDWTERGDLDRAAWFSDYEDPNNWFNVLWQSASDPNAFNGGWRNDRYDALVGQATGELNPARRAELYGQADAIMAQDYPHIPLFHYEVRTLVKPYVQGYNPSRVLGLTPLRSMSIVGSP